MIDWQAKPVIFVTIAVLLLLGLLSRTGLYADGSAYLYQIALGGGFYEVDPARVIPNLITQAPIRAALSLGLKDLGWLSYIYSASLVLVPNALWLMALFMSRKDRNFWLMVVAFTIGWLLTGLAAIGEFNTCFALAAFCLAILVRDTWRIWHPLALVAAAVAFTHSYEATLFIGPLLGLVAVHRLLFNVNDTRLSKVLVATAAAIFVYAAAIAVVGVIVPRDPGNRLLALSPVNLLDPRLWLLAALGFLYRKELSSGSMSAYPHARKITVGVVIFSIAFPFTPLLYFAVRAVAGVCLAFVLAAAAVVSLEPGWAEKFYDAEKFQKYARLLFFGLAIALACDEIGYGWWLGGFQKQAEQLQANTPIDHIPGYESFLERKYSWSWTQPQTSLLLRRNGNAIILNCTCYTGWQAFDPNELKADPLARYR